MPRSPERGSRSRTRLSLLISSAAVFAGILLASELALMALGLGPTSLLEQAAHFLPAVLASALLVGWVSRELNGAARDDARLAEQRWRAEQAEGLAAFSRVLAHELRNPLNAIALHTTVVRRHVTASSTPEAEQLRESAAILDQETRRANRLLDDYLAYGKGRAQSVTPEPIELDLLAREAIESFRPVLELRKTTYQLSRSAELPRVHADRSQLMRAIKHVLHNALEALPSGGRLELSVGAEGDQVVLTITDDGPGFEDPDAVFRPFYTTRSSGAGLGLTIVRDIARAHRGEVRATNVGAKGGARVELRLPAGGAP